ncbi:MAG TPA: envelope stress response membrane protein PspC [Allosphingosinicella sp.]
MAGPRTRFYVDRHHRKIAGVCAGISEHFGWDVTLVRVGMIASLFVAGPLVPAAYLLTAWMAPSRPSEMDRLDRQDPDEKKFWQKVRRNPRATVRSVRARFRDIDRRLAHAEAYLTSPDKRLAREIDQLR